MFPILYYPIESHLVTIKELNYLSLYGKMMAVDIHGGSKIEPGIPRVLFDTGLNVDPEK